MELDETLLPPGLVHVQRVPLTIDYPVIFQRDCLNPAHRALRWAMARGRRTPCPVLVAVDSGLLEARPTLLEDIRTYLGANQDGLRLSGEILVVPGGEPAKSDPALLSGLHGAMLGRHLDRHAVCLIFGGGAALDAVGFAAATFHRGLRVVRVPTTVLAQNDAGVGVKNGVNAHGVKNLIGTFQAPYAVVNDIGMITTLADRDVRSGLAEAVKVALIRDADFFFWLVDHAELLASRQEDALEESIRRAALLHLRHISQGGDPFETGSARPLDFGHWSAHKLESLSEHGLRHGEAVAIGMAIDVVYAAKVGLLAPERASQICGLLRTLGFLLSSPLLLERRAGSLAVLQGLEEFREHIGGDLLITLISDIGVSVEVQEIDRVVMEQAILEVAAGAASSLGSAQPSGSSRSLGVGS